MAAIYKRNGTGKYLIDWSDHKGKRCTKSSGTTDKASAIRIGNKLEADAALRRENVIDTRLEAIAQEGQKLIGDVLDTYQASMSASGKTTNHIDSTGNKINSIVADQEWSKLADVQADGLNRFCSDLRNAQKAPRTIAAYIQAIKGFTRWATKNGKLASDPLVTVSKPSAENGRKLVRRYLKREEWQWLDSITRSSQERFGMSGQERAVLYALAIQTGFRSAECRSLTRGSLFLKGSKPYVMANASDTKNGKQAKQYIQTELATELLNMTRTTLAGKAMFNMPHESTVVDMIREDMGRAKLAWLDTHIDPQERQEADAGDFLSTLDSESKRIDFHSLRHTCGTWLAQAGVDIKTVQSIMRHSTIVLTMDRYGHLYEGAESDAVAKVRSSFASPIAQTGTNRSQGLQWNPQCLGRGTVREGAESCHSSGIGLGNNRQKKTLVSQGITKENQGFGPMRAERLELSTQGLKVLCSTN